MTVPNLESAQTNTDLTSAELENYTNSTGYADVIETVISSLDSENTAMVNHSEEGSTWKFTYGSVEVFIQITGETDDDFLTVWASVLKLPAQDEPGLMRKLLEMNWGETFETRFGIVNDEVVVLSQRTVADLRGAGRHPALRRPRQAADDRTGGEGRHPAGRPQPLRPPLPDRAGGGRLEGRRPQQPQRHLRQRRARPADGAA